MGWHEKTVTRAFTPLLPFHTVMAMEASPNSDRPPLDPEGLCNAVILSRPGERFLERWLESYKDFDGGDWAGLSVRKPWVRSPVCVCVFFVGRSAELEGRVYLGDCETVSG